jgi:ATP-dependent Lon protease
MKSSSLLETNDMHARVEQLLTFMESEIDILKVEKRIRGRVKKADGEEPARVLPE